MLASVVTAYKRVNVECRSSTTICRRRSEVPDYYGPEITDV
jgi:hypothetical protein